MQIKKILIKDMYGISGQKEYDLDEKTVALFGNNGTGKSSFLKALNFAVSGQKTPEMIRTGQQSAAVMFETDNGLRVDRLAERTASGNITVKSWLNTVKSPAQKVQQEIADNWGTETANLKILSSKDLEDSLAKDAGQILLSYADDRLSEDEVRQILKKAAAGDPDSGINSRTIDSIKIGKETDWNSARELSSRAIKARREAKADLRYQETARQRLVYSLPQLPDGTEEIPAEDAAAELEKINAYELSSAEASKRMEEYRKSEEHRDKILKEIKTRKEALDGFAGEHEAPEKLDREKEELISEGNESRRKISASEAIINQMTPIYEKMGTGICPLWDKIKCGTDMTDAKDSIRKDIEAAEKTIGEETKNMEAMQKKYTDLKERIEKAEKIKKISDEIGMLEKALPPEIKKPDIPELKDYKDRKTYLKAVIDRDAVQKKIADIDSVIKKDNDTIDLTDFIAESFSEKGPVVSRILDIYLEKLTDAAEKAESETGVGVVFSYDEGLKIGYRINGGSTRPYSTLSSGEQAMAFLTVSDLLHRIASVPVLVIDDLDRLDLDNLDRFLTLLDRVKGSYENVILAGVGHRGVDGILEKHGIKNMMEENAGE